MNVIFVRHGQFSYDPSKEFYDPSLTEEGRKQARELAGKLKDDGERPSAIYTSGTLRCVQAAEILRQELGVETPAQVEEAFTLPGVFWQSKCYYHPGTKPEEIEKIESRMRMLESALRGIDKILKKHQDQGEETTLIVVTSSPVILALDLWATYNDALTAAFGSGREGDLVNEEHLRNFEKQNGPFRPDCYLVMFYSPGTHFHAAETVRSK